MSDFIGDWHALVVLLVAGVLPNQIWRWLGLWLGGGLDEGSDLLMWVKAVATAILAGVIAEIVVQPPGALASVPEWLRYTAVLVGFAGFMASRKSIFTGVVCGEISSTRAPAPISRGNRRWATVPPPIITTRRPARSRPER